jgi:GxxExxY protein
MGHTESTESTEKGIGVLHCLTERVFVAAIEVHRVLGPGLLESAYEQCLAHELALTGLRFKRQVELPVQYKGLRLEAGFRADVIVEDALVVEVKAIEVLLPLHIAQVVTYLRMSNCNVGLLINFNAKTIKDGLKRIVV